jgi:hypothetical protein
VLTNPLVYLPVWHRSWLQAVSLGAWFLVNSRLFPPPEGDSSWTTCSVLGEKLWIRPTRADLPMVQNMLSALFFLVAFHSAYTHRLQRLVSFGGLALPFKLWFLKRMVAYYEEHHPRPWWRRLLGYSISENSVQRKPGVSEKTTSRQ